MSSFLKQPFTDVEGAPCRGYASSARRDEPIAYGVDWVKVGFWLAGFCLCAATWYGFVLLLTGI